MMPMLQKKGRCVLQLVTENFDPDKNETDSKHVGILDLAGLEKQLHVSETCISAEISCD